MTTTITGALGIDNIKAATGAVLQVVSVSESVEYVTTSGNWAARMTGNDVTITPSSASNKILIIVSTQLSFQYDNTYGATDLYRSISGGASTYNLSGESSGMNTNMGFKASGLSYSYEDTPNTTSAVTYSPSFKFSAGGVGSVYLGRNDTKTVVTLMEIAG
jgi:hypothetical protein